MSRCSFTGGQRRCRSTRGVTQLEATIVVLLASPLMALGTHEVQVRLQRARTQEALDNVASIYRGAVAYYEAECRRTHPKQFPASVGPSPSLATLSRARGRRLKARLEDWEQASWQALSFVIGDPHRYVYQFDSLHRADSHEALPPGNPNAFTARAHGDLDGDGVFSTFERGAMVDPTASVVGGPLHVERELE